MKITNLFICLAILMTTSCASLVDGFSKPPKVQSANEFDLSSAKNISPVPICLIKQDPTNGQYFGAPLLGILTRGGDEAINFYKNYLKNNGVTFNKSNTAKLSELRNLLEDNGTYAVILSPNASFVVDFPNNLRSLSPNLPSDINRLITINQDNQKNITGTNVSTSEYQVATWNNQCHL